MNKEFRVFDKWISIGFSFRGFGLGFRISKWSFTWTLASFG